MADEASVTLEELEREAEEALKADEGMPNTESEEAAQGAAEEGEEPAAEEGSSAQQGAQAEGKGKTVNIPVAKLQQHRQERREAREREASLTQQNEELRRQLAMSTGSAAAVPKAAPTLEGCDYDEAKYQQALADWLTSKTGEQMQALEEQRAQAARQQQYQQRLDEDMTAHYQRVSQLGVDENDFIPAERSVRDQFGDSAVEQMISAIGEGSEKVVFHLGRNQEERAKVAALLQRDPSGLTAMSYCGRLAEKLNSQPSTKKISQAPAADRPVTGGSGASGASNIVKRLKQLDGMANRDQFRQYKQKLIASGHSALLQEHGYL